MGCLDREEVGFSETGQSKGERATVGKKRRMEEGKGKVGARERRRGGRAEREQRGLRASIAANAAARKGSI